MVQISTTYDMSGLDPHWWTVAHVVGMRPPGLFSWIAAIALFGGIFGVLVGRRRVRLACAVLALAGLGGTIADLIVRGERPSRPDLLIRLVSPPARTTDPMPVRLCGLTARGTPTSPTAGGRYLLIRVDGVQVGEVHSSTVLVPVRPGLHLLTVEISSPDHQEYQPALLVRRPVQVSGAGTPQIPPCRR